MRSSKNRKLLLILLNLSSRFLNGKILFCCVKFFVTTTGPLTDDLSLFIVDQVIQFKILTSGIYCDQKELKKIYAGPNQIRTDSNDLPSHRSQLKSSVSLA